MFRIGKTFKFDAAHKLNNLPESHQCSRLHGHTYKVTVVLRAAATVEPGWLVDYGELSPFKKHLDQTYDHRYLNDIVDFNPTAELLAAHLYGIANAVLELPEGVYVDAIQVQETESTFAEYSRP